TDPKMFWRVKIEDVDSDGDGLTDAEEYVMATDPNNPDSDGDTLADLVEILAGTAPNNPDSDNDGLTDGEEYALGTNPNKADTDEDGSNDSEDAVPTDKAIWWPKTPVPRYAIVATGIPCDDSGSFSMPTDINRSGDILVKFDSGSSREVWSIWSPATGLCRDVTPPLQGFFDPSDGDLIDASRIAEDGSHHASLSGTLFTDQISIFLPPGSMNQPPTANDWILHFPGSRDSVPPKISYHVDTVDSWSLSTSFDTTIHQLTWKSRQIVNGNWVDAQSGVDDTPLSISPAGGILFETRIERTGQPDIPVSGAPSGPTNLSVTTPVRRLGTVLVPAPEPGQPDKTRAVHVIIDDSGMWVEKPDGSTLLAATSSPLPDMGRITENGIALASAEVWLNGSIYSPKELVSPSGWSYIELVAMSTNGLIAATAERDVTGAREIVLLEPIAARALNTVLWDDNTPYDPKGLAKGIDRLSSLASDGDGKSDEFWITAPIGGDSTVVRFLTAAHTPHTIGMTANPHFSDTLVAPDEFSTITGAGTTSEDVPVTFKISGTMEADNHPVRLKVMKKRTVKVVLHEVMGRDKENGNPIHPVFMPDPTNLASYLNQVYGPQVNVNFEVVSPPFVEAGPGDANNDGMLDITFAADVSAGTTNAKVGAPGSDFNIDVWVLGGVSLVTPVQSIRYEHVYGTTLPTHAVMGRRILVDGDMVGFKQVPAGSQRHHLHFTIAHEIGHVMTDDVHPGDQGYKSELIWGCGPDPHMKRRLMCSGTEADHAHPEVCLIKKEWDRIETWLKSEETRLGKSL
ncbi:MAG: hypothetical protein WCS43_17280, partial [Verrucomicrobiota bacterium]